MIIIFVTLLIGALLILFWQLSNVISIFFGCPYVTINRKIITQILKTVGLKKGEIFYDLGCGKGDVLIEAAKFGAQATGFEISPFYFLYAKLRTLRYRNIIIKYQNIEKVDYSKADVIYCYLVPKFLVKLHKKFQKELSKTSCLISVGFPVEGFKGKILEINKRKIYLYQRK